MEMFVDNIEKNVQLIINLKKNLLDIDKKVEVNSASEHRLMVPICEKMTKSSYLVAEEHRVKQNDAFCPFLSNKFPHTGGPLLRDHPFKTSANFHKFLIPIPLLSAVF